MIQDIAPHRYDNAYHPTQPKDGDRVFFYQDGSTLLSRESSLPFTWEEANARADLSTLPCTYFFSIDDIAFHWCHVVPSAILDAAVPAKNGQFRDMQPGWLAFACITASQLYSWYHSHQFCGRCGAPAQQDAVERAMRCPACGGLVYPTISPAVIVAVTHGDRLLLTKYSQTARPGTVRNYALIAGFAEIGEPLEGTVPPGGHGGGRPAGQKHPVLQEPALELLQQPSLRILLRPGHGRRDRDPPGGRAGRGHLVRPLRAAGGRLRHLSHPRDDRAVPPGAGLRSKI